MVHSILVSCLGRYHFFEQAAALQLLGHDVFVHSTYPKSYVARWGVGPKNASASLTPALLTRLSHRIFSQGSRPREWMEEKAFSIFAKSIPARRQSGSYTALIANSGALLEAFPAARQMSRKILVDHGSLHYVYENSQIRQACAETGVSATPYLHPPWLIDRQTEEFERADAVLVLSNRAKETLVGRGVPAPKIQVVGMGVDTSVFYEGDYNVRDPYAIVFCGGVIPRKGVHILIDTLQELLKTVPKASLTVIGAIPAGAYSEMIRRRASNLPIRFTGPLPWDKLSAEFRHAGVFAFPSYADGFGMVVLQAMATGLPAVVSEDTGARDYVNAMTGGYVVPNGRSYVTPLAELMSDPSKQRAMSAAAARTASTASWEAYARRLEAVLDC